MTIPRGGWYEIFLDPALCLSRSLLNSFANPLMILVNSEPELHGVKIRVIDDDPGVTVAWWHVTGRRTASDTVNPRRVKSSVLVFPHPAAFQGEQGEED